MSKSRKLFIGLLSFLPLVFLLLYFAWFVGLFLKMLLTAGAGGDPTAEMPAYFFDNIVWLIVLVVFTALLSLGLLIYFIVHVINNKAIDSSEKLIWILVFVFAHILGYPIYWYMRIWKDTPAIHPPGTAAM
ncbi:MAG TPA: PLDc N-terminal domain-containing protein [Agriterribacter sp.]|nr:PLDc N-terminal domain-containing protein [Agriterribacter sp.]